MMSDDGYQEKYSVWNKVTGVLGSAISYRANHREVSILDDINVKI